MSHTEIEAFLPQWAVRSEIFSVIITDFEGKYIYVNEVFKKRFAWMNANFIGQPFSVTVHPEDVEKCNLAAYECMTNPGKIIPIKIRKPVSNEGIHEWTDWEFSSFRDKEGNVAGVFCIGYDITNLKIFTAESLIAKFKLKNIAFVQSHEVRAPVATILGLVNLMLKENDPQTNLRYLNGLRESAEKLDQIIHKVVGLTKD